MEDTSYLFTEYGRRKEYEGYEMEMKERELEQEIRDRCNQIIGTLDQGLPHDLKICRIKDRNNDIAKLLEDFLPV